MDGLLDIAMKVFLFITLITCWRQLLRISMSVIGMAADLLWQWFHRMHDRIEGLFRMGS